MNVSTELVAEIPGLVALLRESVEPDAVKANGRSYLESVGEITLGAGMLPEVTPIEDCVLLDCSGTGFMTSCVSSNG